jgi:hypothetical protein
MSRTDFRQLVLVFILFLLTPVCHSDAITLGFDPVQQDCIAGDSVDVDLFITGLGNGIAPSLGAWDISIQFDPTIVGFDYAVYGDQLGVSVGGGSGVNGTLNLSEVSLESAADLNNLQAASFILATLTYDLLAVGTSPLNITSFVLSDAFGSTLEANVSGGEINVVPEPATMLLLGAGFAGFRRKKFSKSNLHKILMVASK